MGQKLVVGAPINRGLRNDRTAFVIDNDSFPTLINAYQWRGRIKRKRGTQFLCRLQRFLGTTDGAGNLIVTISPTPITSGISSFVVGTDVFVDQGGASPVAMITNSSGTGTLDRSTGVLTISGSQPATAVIMNPTLPVMGLEDLILDGQQFPGTMAFDTVYSYQIQTASPYRSYDVSFYKNIATGTTGYPGYVQKASWTPTTWNGQDYQQFWTINYQSALWATNGINIPFSITNIGMQYKPITGFAFVAFGPPAAATLTITAHGLVLGDFVFINEIIGVTGINFQTGYVTVVVDANHVTVEFPNATIGGAYVSGGIAQYLTNRSDTTKDCLRWYDGDPTNGSATTPVFVTGKGWVNFAPPLSQSNFSIAEQPLAQYYLVGARMIVPFKDRLLFFGPVIQTSAAGSQIYLQDTIIYSQNGTPFYTCSYTGSELNTATVFHPLLTPTNQTATPTAYWEDQTGFGGFQSAGIDRAITTVSTNEDALIVGFEANIQTRVIYTGNDLVPFNFFIINAELGSSSTFSAINMDSGVITRGNRGYIITSQTEARRVDLEIPDEVFETRLTSNGTERVTAQRDFRNEWAYFTYPSDSQDETVYKFPTRTLQFNYRDNSWAIFNESYTTYGTFRKQTGFIWSTVGDIYNTWIEWTDPWNDEQSELEQSLVIGGNQQGFVLIRGIGTGEEESLTIQNIVGNIITSPDHCLNTGDYITILGALGTVSTSVNSKIFSITAIDENTFSLNPALAAGLTYLGGGLIIRLYVPQIQTKQFPLAWEMGRKTRIGVQQYLLEKTNNAQITLQIFLSQNGASPYNASSIVPDTSNLVNSGLLYSQILYTCPESTNLGLTPANINLQTPTASQQSQIWHRINTSLIGDTVQLGFTLSDAQMRAVDDNGNFISQEAEIELHGFIIDVSPSQLLS